MKLEKDDLIIVEFGRRPKKHFVIDPIQDIKQNSKLSSGGIKKLLDEGSVKIHFIKKGKYGKY